MKMDNSGAYSFVDSRYGALTIFANDTGAVTQSLLTYGEWAENEIRFLRRFVPNGGTVLDIGAYIGTHTLAFARFVGPTGRVIAIEAQPDTFNVLEKNIAANVIGNTGSGPHGVVQLANAIASRELAQLNIKTIDIERKSSFGSASLLWTLNDAPPALNEDDESETRARAYVRAITIDSLDLQDCALIKIDVEGVENMVLSGAVHTLERCSPVVYCECNDLAAGLKSMAVLESVHYKVFAHVVNAYNSDNFFNVEKNIFGDAREVALVAVPETWAADIRSLPRSSSELLLEIEDADDLALALLNKPQYQSEVLRLSHAAKTGGVQVLDQYEATNLELDRWQRENAILQRLRSEEQHTLEQHFQATHEEDVALLRGRDDAIAELHALLTQRDADIVKLQALVGQRDRDIGDLHAILAQRDSDLVFLIADVEQKNRGMAEAHLLLAQRKADMDRLVAQSATKDSDLVQIKTLVSKLYASKSWRVTRPLRWATRQLGRLHNPKSNP